MPCVSTGRQVWLPVLAVLLTTAPAGAATIVTTCGSTVVGTATLAADLDCSAYPGAAVNLNGRLKLNGFTLTGSATASGGIATVDCQQAPSNKCQVFGPGTIQGGGIGVTGFRVLLKDVKVTGAHTGVLAPKAVIKSSLIVDNGLDGPLSSSQEFLGGGVLVPRTLLMLKSTVTGNGFYGVLATGDVGEGARIMKSTVTGNGVVAAYCSGQPLGCADLVTRFATAGLRTRQTTCGSSLRGTDGDTWGICSGD